MKRWIILTALIALIIIYTWALFGVVSVPDMSYHDDPICKPQTCVQ